MNWVSLVYSTFGKGLSVFTHLSICFISWITIISFKICFKCWCFISKWTKATLYELCALFAILLFYGITPNLTDLLTILVIGIAIGHTISFKNVWYKNQAISYFLTTFWEDYLCFKFRPINGGGNFHFYALIFPLPYLGMLISLLEGDNKVEIQALEKVLDYKTIKCMIFFTGERPFWPTSVWSSLSRSH